MRIHHRGVVNLSLLLIGTLLFSLPAWAGEPPFDLPKEVSKLRSATIYTDYGDIQLELFPQDAPWHVANFKYLADKGYYRNTRFHIYQPGYIIQGGDRGGTGRGGPGYSLPQEFNEHRHSSGTIGMARSADHVNPSRDSHGSQFYITLEGAPHMNGQYTVFGQVGKGMDVVQQLRKDDRVIDIKVFVHAAATSTTQSTQDKTAPPPPRRLP